MKPVFRSLYPWPKPAVKAQLRPLQLSFSFAANIVQTMTDEQIAQAQANWKRLQIISAAGKTSPRPKVREGTTNGLLMSVGRL